MTPLQLLGLAVTLVVVVAAQSSDDRIWAVVAFVNHGEKTPELGELGELGDLSSVLTPAGAQQMHRQGAAFRKRYLSQTNNSTFIAGIETKAIDNSQLKIESQARQWTTAGAMAFLQGLYPPVTASFRNALGGEDLAHNFVGSRNASDYPMDGYQYPNIETISTFDQRSIAIQGNFQCTRWQTETNLVLPQREDMASLNQSTFDFYQQLFSTDPLKGTIDVDYAHFWNAYQIYEYVNYMYAHNETVFDNLKDANKTLSTLARNAEKLERARNSLETSKMEDVDNILYTIAGRTLATAMFDELKWNIVFGGIRNKMKLFFGSHEPLIAFFAVAGLLGRRAPKPSPFNTLPEPGAAMIFELYSNSSDNSEYQPDHTELMVRFYYRANADEGTPFENYSLFSSGYDGASLSFTALMRIMHNYGQRIEGWCEVCESYSSPWCLQFTDGGRNMSGSRGGRYNSSHKYSFNPVIAGVIGAMIMMAILGLVALGLCALGGFRFRRFGTTEQTTAGGFKGAEKKDEDRDVIVTKGGTRHERIGSWEMRQGDNVVSGGAGRSLDEDEISIVGATPVKAHEGV